jgi:hypothetical protein
MNNSNTSLATADLSTHVKVVVVALVAAIAVTFVGLSARIDPDATNLQASAPVLKAGKPMTVTTSETTVIR